MHTPFQSAGFVWSKDGTFDISRLIPTNGQVAKVGEPYSKVGTKAMLYVKNRLNAS